MLKRTLTTLLAVTVLSGCSGENDVFLRQVEDIHNKAANWFVNNVRDKGLFHYIYHPKTNEYPDSNNAIRQLMGSRLLAEMAREDPDLLELHRKNLKFHMEHWYREDGEMAYVYYSKKSKLGAIAMLLRTLVWSPDFEEYEEEARKLANGILHLMNEDGSFEPFLIEPDYDYDKDYILTFYSGEALVALAEYYMKTEQQDILDAAIKGQNFYIDRYVSNLKENYYPAYVPWHSMSLNLLWKITKNPDYATAAFLLNDELLNIFDRTHYIGRFYNPQYPEYGRPHSSSDGVYTEGLAYAYELAVLTGDKVHEDFYLEALKLAVQNIASLQYTEELLAQYNYKRPDRALGAIKYSADRSGIRVDTVQHNMDALRKIMVLLGTRKEINFVD